MKTPTRFHQGDWLSYFGDAIFRETGTPWEPTDLDRTIVASKIKKATKGGIDLWMLALGLDILAVEWKERSRLWYAAQLFEPGPLMYPLYEQGPVPEGWWRDIWFSRYAEGEPEIDYFNFWMEVLDHTRDQPSEQATARAKLDKAHQIIIDRGGTKGGPMFQHHLIRLLLAEEPDSG